LLCFKNPNFLDAIVKEDRSALDLIDADFTFLTNASPGTTASRNTERQYLGKKAKVPWQADQG
jgi:hypothetical protein